MLKSGRRNLIGRGLQHLVPPETLAEKQASKANAKPNLGKGGSNSKHKSAVSHKGAKQQRQQPGSKGFTKALTKHTGLAPAEGVGIDEKGGKPKRKKPAFQNGKPQGQGKPQAKGKPNSGNKPAGNKNAKSGGFKKPTRG